MLANRTSTQGFLLSTDDVSYWRLHYYTQRAALLLAAAQTAVLPVAGEQRRLAALSRRLKDIVDGRVGIHLAVPVVDMATQLLRVDAPLLERAMDAHKWVLYAQQQRQCALTSQKYFNYVEASSANSSFGSNSSARSGDGSGTGCEDEEDEEQNTGNGQSVAEELPATTTTVSQGSNGTVYSGNQTPLRRYVSATNPHGFLPTVVSRLDLLSPADRERAVKKLLANRKARQKRRADPVARKKMQETNRRSYHKMKQLHREQAAAKRQKCTTDSPDKKVTL